jgi:hypothetical protein
VRRHPFAIAIFFIFYYFGPKLLGTVVFLLFFNLVSGGFGCGGACFYWGPGRLDLGGVNFILYFLSLLVYKRVKEIINQSGVRGACFVDCKRGYLAVGCLGCVLGLAVLVYQKR